MNMRSDCRSWNVDLLGGEMGIRQSLQFLQTSSAYLWAWLGQTFTFTRRCLESAITLTCSNCFAINPSLQTDQMKISRRESEQKTDLIIWVQLRSQLRFSAWLPISWPSSHNPTFGELVSKLRAWLAGSNFYFHPHSAMS